MKEGIYGKLSDGQTFTNIDSTGEVSSNVFDLETNGVVDDQMIGYMNVTVISAVVVNLTEGIQFEVRTAALAALASLPEILGAISVLPGRIVAGAQFSVPFKYDICQAHVGGWARAVSTANVGAIVLDMEFSDHPVGFNESIQKMPS